MWAADKGHMVIVSALVKAGANVNAKDQDGWTALLAASGQQNSEGIVEALIHANADVNARSKVTMTA